MVEFFFPQSGESSVTVPVYTPPLDNSSEGIFNIPGSDYPLSFSYDGPSMPEYYASPPGDDGDPSPAYVDGISPPAYSQIEGIGGWVNLDDAPDMSDED